MKLSAIRHLLWAGLTAAAFAATAQDGWESLRQLDHRDVFTIFSHDGSCVSGRIVSISDTWIILAPDKTHERQVLRPAVVRITLGDDESLASIVFSGRSSWADVQTLLSVADQTVLVVTTDGKEFAGKLLNASDSDLTISGPTQELKFAKDYLERVSLVRLRRGGLDGKAWRHVHSKEKLARDPVLLYESSQKEDDEQVKCAAAPAGSPSSAAP